VSLKLTMTAIRSLFTDIGLPTNLEPARSTSFDSPAFMNPNFGGIILAANFLLFFSEKPVS